MNWQKSINNLFLIIGVVALVAMCHSLGFQEIIAQVKQTGLWLVPILGVWAAGYALNTVSYKLIIDTPEKSKVPFIILYKITVSTFAINNATPMGLAGGEPYKIMAMSPLIGKKKAASSVILFSMMHFTAHFIFWMLSALLAVFLIPMDSTLAVTLTATFAVCFTLTVITFKGQQSGMISKTLKLLRKMPLLGKPAARFAEERRETIETIDEQIASLHKHSKTRFYTVLANELVARVLNCAEIHFMLLAFGGEPDFADSIIIMAFVSLFTNILFFSPMQIGTREASFILIFKILALNPVWAMSVSFITRIREIFWIFIGVVLMKIKDGKVEKRQSP